MPAVAAAPLPAAGPARAKRKVPQGAEVLLLGGGQREHHGDRDQALYLSEPPDDTGRYAVTIADLWHPVLRGPGDFGLHDDLYANMPMKDET